MSRSRSDMPSKSKIQNWWARNTQNFDLPEVRSDKAATLCWGCGFHANLERSHIKALSEGGTNECSNLVLLCPYCHLMQESVCTTDEGRKRFVEEILDGAPYMTIRMQALLEMARQAGLYTPTDNGGVNVHRS